MVNGRDLKRRHPNIRHAMKLKVSLLFLPLLFPFLLSPFLSQMKVSLPSRYFKLRTFTAIEGGFYWDWRFLSPSSSFPFVCRSPSKVVLMESWMQSTLQFSWLRTKRTSRLTSYSCVVISRSVFRWKFSSSFMFLLVFIEPFSSSPCWHSINQIESSATIPGNSKQIGPSMSSGSRQISSVGRVSQVLLWWKGSSRSHNRHWWESWS